MFLEDMKQGWINGRPIREIRYNGNVIWPSQAYTYNLYNIRVFDGVNQTNIINAGGTNRLYVLADVDVLNGTTTVKTITDVRLTPVSSTDPTIILSDKPYITAESRGEIEGPERTGIQVVCEAYGHTVTVQVAQEANELLARLVDMSAASATPSSYSDIPQSGTIMQVAYISRCAVTRVFTAGTFGGDVEDATLNLCVEMEGGDTYTQKIEGGGTGFAYVTIPQNFYIYRRTISLYMIDIGSEKKSAVVELYQEGTESVGRVRVTPFIDEYTGKASIKVELISGQEPSSSLIIRIGSFRIQPTGGAIRDVDFSGSVISANIGDIVDIGYVPLPEQYEEGIVYCWNFYTQRYDTTESFSSYRLNELAVWTYAIDPSSIRSRMPSGSLTYSGFAADGTRRLHFDATIIVYKNGTEYSRLTRQPLIPTAVPVSPSGVQFYIDGMEVYNASRGRVVGPSENIDISLIGENTIAVIHSVTLEANSLRSTDYDVSESSVNVLNGAIIPYAGGNVTFHYVARAGLIETYTSGTYTDPIRDTAMELDIDNRSLSSDINVPGGEGNVIVNMRSNNYAILREFETSLRIPYPSGSGSRVKSLGITHTQAAYETDTNVIIYPSISNQWEVYVNMDLISGPIPSMSSMLYTAGAGIGGGNGYFYIHFLPNGGVERSIRLDSILNKLKIGTPAKFTVAAPSQAEEGECWIQADAAEYVNIQSLPRVHYSYTP